jgi:hypothetical protein
MEKIKLIKNPDKTTAGSERQTLVDRLAHIARTGFGTNITQEDVENHVMQVDKLYLIMEDSVIAGFSSYGIMEHNNRKILYLHGIVVMPEFQKHGIFQRLNRLALSEENYDFLAMRTQNPVVYAATEHLVKKLFPNRKKAPEDVKKIAVHLALDHLKMQAFDEETFVGRHTYGTCLYSDVPKHQRSSELFDSILKLDYKAGDSVILVGRL